MWMGDAPHANVIETVENFREVRFTTDSAEQDHASVTLQARSHPRYGVDMLACGSFAHSFRTLLHEPPKDKVRILYEKALQKLEEQTPQRLHAQNIYLREVLAAMYKRHSSLSTGELIQKHRDIVRRHTIEFKQLPIQLQRSYEVDAYGEATSHTHQIETTHEELSPRLNKIKKFDGS